MCAEESCDIVVVGAGLSGLSAARDLKRRNKQLNVLVLEAKGASQNDLGTFSLTVGCLCNEASLIGKV